MTLTSVISLWLSLQPTLLAAPDGKGEYQLTIYQVWAADSAAKDDKGKIPRGLEGIQEQLRKTWKKGAFRLEAKPRVESLRAGATVTEKLPGGYEVRLTLERDAKEDKVVVRQVLVNPDKKESVIILKESPVHVSVLKKITRGSETLLLVIQLEKAGK